VPSWGGVASLRAVEATFKANSISIIIWGEERSALDALACECTSVRWAFFAETFAMLGKKADRHTRAEGAEMVRLIDSKPNPVGQDVPMGRMEWPYPRLKMHVVYHPGKGWFPALCRDYAGDRQ